MYRLAALLLVVVMVMAGCAPGPSPVPQVALQAPANGSSVSSLTPALSWGSSGADVVYRVQLASDSGFQSVLFDESNLGGLSYGVPSGKLSAGNTYYWRVSASRNSQTSGWSDYWSFQTQTVGPTTGAIVVNATLDGSSWTGQTTFAMTGPQPYTGTTVSQTFSPAPVGSYTIGYGSGGPSGAVLSNITPSATQSLAAGGTVTFMLNFTTIPKDTIVVNGTLDGYTWGGNVVYSLSGPKSNTGTSVSHTFSGLSDGIYTLTYNSGGPSGATLSSITPYPTLTLSAGGTAVFTLNFRSVVSLGTVRVSATLDGAPWAGSLSYSLQSTYTDSYSAVPYTFTNRAPGTYTLVFRSGGPSGAVLSNISPAPTQTLGSGSSIAFTFNFYTSSGTVQVRATLDGQSWSGSLVSSVSGPTSYVVYKVPYSTSGMAPGTYSLVYSSGGPSGATLFSITPSSTQTLGSGSSVVFVLNFQSTSGTMSVSATLDGSVWSGRVQYRIDGPYSYPYSLVPASFTGAPVGTYTLTYLSGGPSGATLSTITPSSTQQLPSGGSIGFTLNFHSAAGTVYVAATLDGKTWKTQVGSGPISFSVYGPISDTGSNIPYTLSSCPVGSYTLTYNSGGPIGATLLSITPSSSQYLSSGGSVTFTMNFASQAKGTIYVRATLDGSPWEGQVNFYLSGPFMDAGDAVPYTATSCPSGSYTLSYNSGGPYQSVLESITPSPVQQLASGGTLTFYLNFRFQGGIVSPIIE